MPLKNAQETFICFRSEAPPNLSARAKKNSKGAPSFAERDYRENPHPETRAGENIFYNFCVKNHDFSSPATNHLVHVIEAVQNVKITVFQQLPRRKSQIANRIVGRSSPLTLLVP